VAVLRGVPDASLPSKGFHPILRTLAHHTMHAHLANFDPRRAHSFKREACALCQVWHGLTELAHLVIHQNGGRNAAELGHHHRLAADHLRHQATMQPMLSQLPKQVVQSTR